MRKDGLLAVFTIQLHSPELIHYTTISPDAYLKLFHSIDESIASKLTFKKPKELGISSDVISLAKKLKNILSNNSKAKCYGLLIEMLDRETDFHTYTYDDLSEGIYLTLQDSNTVPPWCITIAISDPKSFLGSVVLEKLLIPKCKSMNIGLILLSDVKKFTPIVLSQGNLPPQKELPALVASSTHRKPPKEFVKHLSTEEIEAELQVLFGHFEVEVDGNSFHLPAIASVKKLARNVLFVRQLRDDISRTLNSSSFNVLTFGIPGGGINELALAVVEGDTKKICNPQKIDDCEKPIVILCDFLCNLYPIETTIRQINARNANQEVFPVDQIVVISIAKYNNVPDLSDIKNISYINTNYRTVPTSDLKECRFCQQNGYPIKGDHFELFAREIKHFDSLTFWEFIKQDARFFRVGHWISTRTPNHYLFTIVAEPIFKRHSYGLAIRLRNMIESNKIHSSWIRKIVCTQGEESTALSIAISEVFGLKQEDVIRIPRKFFNSTAGKQIDLNLPKYIQTEYGEDALKRRNVLIVDQAAHHFKTMTSLRDVCEYYDCTVMAFAVFLDRTDTDLSLGEYLYDSNYFALYSWPVPPRISHECPCKKKELP